ncbi:O-antigen ligase family protein [Devosia sp. RR2S18]|uniref:O-antigen ligase family protein n=1 Tax=Devosia rhizosphaerae TaxID=3049774 RepID=UPI002540E24E|nr:O-antigen ligase family protein [Devosia sp. RR2S18]WIJ23918.1 O-antigen ligase family protein [Devosia sp. RR2S18]
MALWACLILVALAPIPLGSVRPLAWGVWCTYLGTLLAAYSLLMHSSGANLRVPLREIGLPGVLFALMLLWLLVQVLPLGRVVGDFPIEGISGLVSLAPTISIDPAATILMFVRHASYGVLFFLVLQAVANPGRRETAIAVVLISCLAYALLGIVALQTGDWILGVDKWAHHGSATGPFVNRNSFATYLAFGCVIASAQLSQHLSARFGRQLEDDGAIPYNLSSILLYALAMLFLLAVIVASQSRMGLTAAAIGATVVFTAMALRSLQTLPAVAAGIALLLAIGMAAIALFGEGIFDRFQTVESSAEVRFQLYYQVLQLIRLRPWSGFGGGAFELAFPLVHQFPVSVDFNWNRAHNSYLSLWSELGLVAGSLPLAVIALIGWRSATAPRTCEADWRSRSIAIGAIAVAAVHSLFDFSLEIQANAVLFVFLLALGFPARSRAQS